MFLKFVAAALETFLKFINSKVNGNGEQRKEKKLDVSGAWLEKISNFNVFTTRSESKMVSKYVQNTQATKSCARTTKYYMGSLKNAHFQRPEKSGNIGGAVATSKATAAKTNRQRKFAKVGESQVSFIRN